MIRIVTKTDKGEVRTSFSDDPFEHFNTWVTTLAVPMPGLPIMELKDALYTKSFEEAGQNHLKLCERVK